MPPLPSFISSSVNVVVTILITMIGLLFVTFFIGRVMPIDPVLSIIGESASQETYDLAYKSLGLDKPVYVQFLYFLSDVAHGDFGVSTLTARPVSEDLIRVFPATVELATIGTIIGVVLGVPLGVIAAVKHGSWIDQIARFIALIGYSMPIFWIGLIGLLIFYGILGWIGDRGVWTYTTSI